MHGSMRRREATHGQSASPCGPGSLPPTLLRRSCSGIAPAAFPDVAVHPPDAFDSDVSGSVAFIRSFANQPIAESPRDAGARRVRLVGVDLDVRNLGTRKRRFREESRGGRRQPAASERAMKPVANLERRRTKTAMQPAAAGHGSFDKDAEHHVASRTPLVLAFGEHRPPLLERLRLARHPAHPRSKVILALCHRASECLGVRYVPAAQQKAVALEPFRQRVVGAIHRDTVAP